LTIEEHLSRLLFEIDQEIYEPKPDLIQEQVHACPEPISEPKPDLIQEQVHACPEPISEPKPDLIQEQVHACPEPVVEVDGANLTVPKYGSDWTC
jgi:hypothetical protein